MLTLEELKAFAPHAHDSYLEALIDASGEQTRAGLTTPLRVCHFLAQAAHETAGFSISREVTEWTPEQMCALWPSRFKTKLDPRILACRGNDEALANLAYSGRADLGNVEKDDGWAYRGGGFFQLTGRAAYHEVGAALGIDLEGMPSLIEDPHVSLNAALHVWLKHNCNLFADHNYGRAIGNAINRGNPYSKFEPIGAEARQQWFDRAWHMFFAHEALPSPDMLSLGASGSQVQHVQELLRQLGYAIGGVDGVFGPVLARAVAAFKLDAHRNGVAVGMEPDEIVGPVTFAAIQRAKPVEHNQERAEATVADLTAAGSTEVVAGQQARVAGQIMLYGAAAEGARQAGLIDQLSAAAKSFSSLQGNVAPAIDAAQWMLGHAWWTMALLAGVWMWTKGGQVVSTRLAAHRSGANLAR